jgi:hypothetical protein
VLTHHIRIRSIVDERFDQRVIRQIASASVQITQRFPARIRNADLRLMQIAGDERARKIGGAAASGDKVFIAARFAKPPSINI